MMHERLTSESGQIYRDRTDHDWKGYATRENADKAFKKKIDKFGGLYPKNCIDYVIVAKKDGRFYPLAICTDKNQLQDFIYLAHDGIHFIG